MPDPEDGQEKTKTCRVLDEVTANAMVSADVFLLEVKTAVIETPSRLDWGENANQCVDQGVWSEEYVVS